MYTLWTDQDRSMGTRDVLSELLHVHPLIGDWEQILQEGPFRLVFVDAKPAKIEGIDKIVEATEIGGFIVINDLTPVEFWPDEWKGQPDPIRDSWLHHHQLMSIEIRTSLKAAAIIARRIS